MNSQMTVAEIDAMYAKRNERGQRLVEVDPQYLRQARAARQRVVGSGDHVEIVNPRFVRR